MTNSQIIVKLMITFTFHQRPYIFLQLSDNIQHLNVNEVPVSLVISHLLWCVHPQTGLGN